MAVNIQGLIGTAPPLSAADAADIMNQSGFGSGGSGTGYSSQADALRLKQLQDQQLSELRHNLGLGVVGGATAADANAMQADIENNPDTGAQPQAAVKAITDTRAAQTAYNQPAAAAQREDTQQAAIAQAQAPGVQAGKNEQALEAQKAASAERIAAGNVIGRQGVADAKARTAVEAAANKATALPAQVQAMRAKADLIMPSIPKIKAEVDRLAPYIGAAGGRWADFMAGTIGSSSFATDEQDAHDLNQLRTSLQGLSAGVAMVHGRGGANMGLINEYNKNLSIGHDPSLLKGAIDGFGGILEQYATPPAAQAVPGAKPAVGTILATPPPTGAAAPAGVTVTRID